MVKIIETLSLVIMGVGCFIGGVYYSTFKFENQLQVWDSNYQIITDKVYTFEKVSDPKTIRHYVKELNKILDDINFLGSIVDSGQLANEALTGFFKTYQKQLDDVNRRLIELYVEVTGSVEQLKIQNNIQYSDIEDNLKLIKKLQKKIQEQNDYTTQVNTLLGQKVKSVEDDVQTIKSSKYGKKIWTIE